MSSLIFNLGVSYIAGLLTFFAGCLAPIAPIYVSFLVGTKSKKNKSTFSKNAVFFTLGFISVFLILGLTVNSLARILVPFKDTVRQFAGVIIIFLGLFYLDIFKLPILQRTYMKNLKPSTGIKASFLMGAVISFAWTPCVGPVLAAILFWVAVIPDYGQGIPLLLMFALGLSTPFIFLGLALDKLNPFYKKISTKSGLIKKLAGALLILFGLSYFLGFYSFITLHILPGLEEKMSILTLDVD